MEIYVLYFLEDRAHENFITALVERIAQEMGVSVKHDVRSAVGGNKVIGELKKFIGDFTNNSQNADIFIIARDSDCKNYSERVEEIKRIFENVNPELLEKAVFCIPDPHIERWYMEDFEALRKVLNKNISIDKPKYDCEKNYYKNKLRNIFREVGSVIGGVEYGDEIVSEIDIYLLEKANANFGKFVRDLKSLLKKIILRRIVLISGQNMMTINII